MNIINMHFFHFTGHDSKKLYECCLVKCPTRRARKEVRWGRWRITFQLGQETWWEPDTIRLVIFKRTASRQCLMLRVTVTPLCQVTEGTVYSGTASHAIPTRTYLCLAACATAFPRAIIVYNLAQVWKTLWFLTSVCKYKQWKDLNIILPQSLAENSKKK